MMTAHTKARGNNVATNIQKQPLQIDASGQLQPVQLSESASLLAVISRAAADEHCDVEKMERLLAMHSQMQARQAEIAFNDALNRVQAHMGRIGTDRTNTQTRSNYATYGKLDRVLRPLYTNEGFSLSYGTEPSAADMVRVTCHVSHREGHTRKYQIDMPADGKGAKGGDVMTKTHATGSATQYGMRYLLKMIFNVATADEDDDGNAADGDTDSSAMLDDWIQAIAECEDKHALAARRKEMIEKLGGGDINKVPAVVRQAAVRRAEELQ